ncbi:hypothetical protein Tco_0377490 [Tanacetum coccineum]
MVMEMFNLILKKKIRESQEFKYHFGYKKLEIAHLCFADDLIVLCNVDIESVKVIKSALDDFSGISGLKPHLNKSTVFFGGLYNEEQSKILKILPFSVGKLPIRYLGVPLITKQLSAAVFQLPKSNIKDINRLLKGFLWCQGTSIWKAETDVNASWGWKNLLKLRDKIVQHVYYKIGNGKKTSVWYDTWHELCPLDQFITNRDIYDERFNKNDSVADLIIDVRWKWTNRSIDNFDMLKHIPVPILHDEIEDVVMWMTSERKLVNFSTAQV